MESSWKPLSALFLVGVCLLIAVTSVLCEEYILPSEVDLCSTHQRGGLNGEHLSSPGDSLIAYVNRTIEDPKVALHCRMRFSSCNHCRLRVTAAVEFYYSRCPPHQNYKEYNNWCVPGCSYIHLYDRDYTNQTAVSYTSSSEFFRPIDYRTESSVLYVIVCSNRSFNHHVNFRLNISAEEKKQTLKGYLDQPKVFSSPFFPEEYLLNSEIYTYAFEADDQSQFITISFDDWQLSKYSTIQFDKANIKGLITGSNSRPWIISDNHKLTMTFNTGPVRIPGLYKAKGFRATYTVHNGDRDLLPFVHTNCGWGINHFHDDSGIITFNPTGNGIDYYDCIWIIKKHPGFHGVMVQILSYVSQDMTYRRNHPNVLEIRRGSTSLGDLVELAYPSTRPNLYFSHHSSEDGFYVRLKGHYYGKKDFIMSYTSFNIANQCGGLFRCDNQRCIPRDLTCNEIDNCGDRSDEIYFNCESTGRPGGSPNSGTSPLNVSIIIPLVVSIFLIVVICLLIIFIRRCRRLSMEAHRAHRRRQCISTVSGSSSSTGRQHRRHRRRDDRNGETLYDPPPSYADVLNNTPIGYLNLGFADASYSATAPVAPPSYEEAISSPGGSNATFNFQGNAPHEDSSDSSSPLSGGHSQTNLSTSYSSDDTHLSRNRHLRHRATSLSSSDSSTDGVCMPSGESAERQADENGCGSSSSQVDREEIHPTQTALTDNSWHGIAKPEDASIEMPDSSTVDIAGHNKNSSKTSNKSTNGVQGENESQDSPAVIRLPSGSSDMLSSPDPESGERRIAPSTTSRARVEQSPLILAPTLLSLASSLDRNDGGGTSSLSAAAGVLTGTRSSLQRPDVTESNLQSHHGSCAVLGEDTSSSDAAACKNQSPSRRDRQSRPSPTRNIPAHIRKAKGSSLMKHMSRSMDDISRHTELGYTDRRPGGGESGSGMPSRQFSKSVQNIAEMPPPLRQGQRADSGDGLLYMDRGPRHHQSQPLLSPPPQASRHLDTRPIPRERSNNSHHHGDARRQGSLEEQHHEARDRNQSRARPSVGVDRNLDRPKMHHEQTRGQSHHSGAQDNGKYGRSRMDLQVMQRRPEAPLHRQPRSQSQPQPKHRRLGPAPGERSGQLRPDIPGSEHRSQTQAGSCHPPYSHGDRTTTNPDLQHRPQSGVMEETARRPDHSTIHPNHNAKSSHTSQGQQHPPYSHSLDRQGARPGYGSDSSCPHPTRNTLSLDRNGQRPQTEHQKLGHSTDMKNQSRANLLQTSSARPPLLPKPDGASSRPPYSGRNHQNSDSSLRSEQDPDKNRVLYTSSDRLPPYRPPSHSTQVPRSQADLHMVPTDKTRPSSRPSGSHHSESNMYPEQNRQWSQPRDFRDSGPDSQARHTAMEVHQTQDQPPRPARASRPSGNASQGSLPETERPNYTEHNPSAVSGVHGDAGALHKSSSSAPSFLSSNMNSPIHSNLDSFTGTPDSLHSSTTGPTTIATSTGTTTANTTYTAASASLPDNGNQRPPHIHGAAGSSEYTSYQSQPLDQGRKEGSDLILNRNAETGRNAARTPTKSAVAVSPSHILQDSRGTGTGSQPVLYLQLGDGEGEFEENDIYV